MTGAGGPCSARIEYDADGPLVPCGRPGAALRRACLHEHVADVYACPAHLELIAIGFCLACRDADGHQCPITLTEHP